MKDSLPFMASAVFRPEFGANQEFSERAMRGMRKLGAARCVLPDAVIDCK